jgi:PAS domain S-box-containing protein
MDELNDPAIYQTILDGLETGVYIVDRTRRIRFWNEGAEKITGYLRQDVVGHFLRDHLLAANDAATDLDSDPEDPINLAFRDGKPSVLNVSILHKKGYRPPIILLTNPIRNSHGAVIGAAESLEKIRSIDESTRRHSVLADSACLDGRSP